MPTAGIMPQPARNQIISRHVMNTIEVRTEVDLQKTQHTSTKSVSVRSQASQALRTSPGRVIVARCVPFVLQEYVAFVQICNVKADEAVVGRLGRKNHVAQVQASHLG